MLRGELRPLVPCLCERFALCCLVARSHRSIEKLEMQQCIRVQHSSSSSAASLLPAPFSTKMRELCVCMRTGYVRTYVGRERSACKQILTAVAYTGTSTECPQQLSSSWHIRVLPTENVTGSDCCMRNRRVGRTLVFPTATWLEHTSAELNPKGIFTCKACC